MSKMKAVICVCCVVAVAGLACLVAGIILLQTKPNSSSASASAAKQAVTCDASSEAKRVGLSEFLQKVHNTLYDLRPDLIATKPNVTEKEIREKCTSYDPLPSKLKTATDQAWQLLGEVRSKDIVRHKLKPRERKALAQVHHYLEHVFGTPYDGNYYAGDYLLGPNFFCWQPICKVSTRVASCLRRFKPATTNDVKQLLGKIESVNHTFSQYRQNLIYGTQAGMVRSREECEAGVQVLMRNLNVGNLSETGPQGIVSQYGFSLKYLLGGEILSDMNAQQTNNWYTAHGKHVNESIRDHVVTYIGQPLHALITYLQTTYMEHCVPSSISSGLATLPLAHVYVNGTADKSQPTNPHLPTGELLNGSRAYAHIMSYFTTTDITPNQVHALGYKMLDILYPQIIELARQQTNQSNNDTAKEDFRTQLNKSDMYYMPVGGIPDIESNATAYARCRTTQSAQTFCPVRWKIIQNLFEDVYKVMSLLDSKTVDMFYFTGAKHTTPNCPLKVTANFNPAMAVPSYRRADFACSHSASYFIPFFLTRPGPKFTQWSVNAHEARPGHHTQVQGHVENFKDTCGGLIGWLDSITSYTAFAEGWGLYAEYPLIANDTDIYHNKPLYKYGMLRSQVWRALRLVVDTGLHYKGFSRQKALQYFEEYIWEKSDVVEKEITRYQSDPGQATAYMVGQLHIMKLRAHAQTELGSAFDLKEFHYQLLKHGSAPLSYLTESIGEYIRCTKNTEGSGCQYVLTGEGSGNAISNDLSADLELFPDHVIDSYF